MFAGKWWISTDEWLKGECVGWQKSKRRGILDTSKFDVNLCRKQEKIETNSGTEILSKEYLLFFSISLSCHDKVKREETGFESAQKAAGTK